MAIRIQMRFTIATLIISGSMLGCAGTKMTGFPESPLIDVPKAAFKLQASSIQWQDNKNFQMTVAFLVPRGTTPVLDEASRNAARERMSQISTLFKDNVATVLQTRLSQKGLATGGRQTITITPIGGYYSGGEVLISLRTTVRDGDTGQIWVQDLNVTSGVLFFGPSNNPATMTYVTDYAGEIMSKFVKADLIR